MATDVAGPKVRDLHLLLLSLLIVLLLVGFAAAFSFNGLYGQDAHEYLRYARRLHFAICCTTVPGDFFWPVMFPLAGAALSFIIPFPFALQLISILSFALAFFYLSKTLILFFPRLQWQVVIYLLLFFVLSPFVLRTSLVAMSESMATFTIVAALFYLFKYQQEQKWQSVVFFALFATVACFTRYPAFIILFIPAGFVFYLILKHKRYIHLFTVALICMAVALPELLIKGFDLQHFSKIDLLNRWSPANFFQHSFDTADGHLVYTIPNILFSLLHFWHPGFLCLGIFLIIFIRKPEFKSTRFMVLIVGWLLNLLFLTGIPTQNQRLFFLSFPLLLIFLFPAFIRFQDWMYKTLRIKFAVFAGVILVVQLLLFGRAIYPFIKHNRLEQNIAQQLQGLPSISLYTFAMNGALQTYEVPQQVFNLQMQTIAEAQAGDFVLFNSGFEKQVQEQPVWQNWQRLNIQFSLKQIQSFPEGWTLYELR